MPTCKYCGKEFSTTAALGGHVRQKHRGDQEEEQGPKRYHDTRCPECGLELPWTTTWEEEGYTVCQKCGTMFHKRTKEVLSRNWVNLQAIGKIVL